MRFHSKWYKGGITGIGSTDYAKIIEISDGSGVSISLGLEADLKSNQRPLVDLILGKSVLSLDYPSITVSNF